MRNLAITALAQDEAGFIWIGTENGLYRYEGGRFERLDPNERTADSFITALRADAAGGMWVATTGKLYRFEAGRRIVMSYDGHPVPIWQGRNLVLLKSGHLLVVSRKQLLAFESKNGDSRWEGHPYFSREQLAAHPELADIMSVQSTADGHLWMGCGLAICEYGSAGELKIWNSGRGVVADRWLALMIDHRGSIWVRGQRHVIERPAGAAVFVDRSLAEASRGAVQLFTPIVEDLQGRIITYTDEGIMRWDGADWQRIGAANGLDSGSPAALLVDRDGDLWLGSGGRGLVQWAGYRNWEAWTVRQGLSSDSIWAILRDRGGVLHVGTEHGQAIFDPGQHRFLPLNPENSKPKWEIDSFAEDAQGGWWAGTFSGILLQAAEPLQALQVVDRLPLLIFRLVNDMDGSLWVTTSRGLFVVGRPLGQTPASRVDAPAAMPAAKDSMPDGCRSRSGTIWFVSDSGLLRYRQGQWSQPRIVELSPMPKFSKIACAADESVWLSGETPGVWHITGDGQFLHAQNLLPADDDLNSTLAMSMLEDRRGWLWLATDAGIGIYDGHRWRQFDRGSGLVWNDCNQNALWEDVDGSMWIGTSNGLAHVLQPATLFAVSPLLVSIAAIDRGGQSPPASGEFSLPWSDMPLVFRLTSPSYTNPHALRFRYRLDGLEQEWTTTAQPEARYPALPGGDYHLEVEAENLALRTHSAPLIISFSIEPPWWKRWPFYGICAVTAFALALLIYRWRLGVLYSHKRELEALVVERTSELEASRQRMQVLALHDGLTGLWNRSAIVDLLANALEDSHRQGQPLAVVLVDLDHFKRINDGYGHASGDEVLRETARRFLSYLGDQGWAGRYGGEEFLLLLPGVGPDQNPDRALSVHRTISSRPMRIDDDREITVTCSVGVAFVGGLDYSPLMLVKRADRALYRAKGQGRNQAVLE